MIRAYPLHPSVLPGGILTLCVSSATARFRVEFLRQGATLQPCGEARFSDGRPAADGAPDVLTATFAGALFVTSPVVVIAAADGSALPTAARAARAAHAPLLLAVKVTPQLTTAVGRLRPAVPSS